VCVRERARARARERERQLSRQNGRSLESNTARACFFSMRMCNKNSSLCRRGSSVGDFSNTIQRLRLFVLCMRISSFSSSCPLPPLPLPPELLFRYVCVLGRRLPYHRDHCLILSCQESSQSHKSSSVLMELFKKGHSTPTTPPKPLSAHFVCPRSLRSIPTSN